MTSGSSGAATLKSQSGREASRVAGPSTTDSFGRLRAALAPVTRALLAWRSASLVLRCLHRYLSIDGTQRALVLAAQAFSALIPLLIVLSTLVSSHGGNGLATTLVERFRLVGNSADAVNTLFAQPPGVSQSVSLGSALLLVLSGLSLARTIQRLYEAAWRLPPRGLRGTFGGLAALALLVTQILLLSLLAGFLRSAPGGSLLVLVLRAVASSALWLLLQHLLLGGRVTWRRLLPGAVAAGVGQQVVAEVSTLWIPNVIENNATRYGTIGVSFALLSWLVVIAVVQVAAAVVSVELGGGPPPVPPPSGTGPALLDNLGRLIGLDDQRASSRDARSDRPTAGKP
jgi:membrane protein